MRARLATRRTIGIIACALACGTAPRARAAKGATVEVMHWWTSGGEAEALTVLKAEFEKDGSKWTDAPVAGGGGDQARTVLKSRIIAGNPPTAAQMHMGADVWDWGQEGALADLDKVAKAEHWDDVLPPFVAERVKYKGKYVAVPVNIHRANWLWVSNAALKKVGGAPPKTWDEFNALATKLKAAGVTALAHGGQPWQDLLLFDAVVLGVGGPAFYRQALLDLDVKALGSDTMVKVFDQMRKLHGFVDKGSPGRDWNAATALVISGAGAMQIMGDWAKAELTRAGKKAGVDFACVPAPQTAGSFSAINDSFAMFAVKGEEKNAGQMRLASLVMGPAFQAAFSLAKGSIPARLGVKGDKFDACGKASLADFAAAVKADAAVPSFGSSSPQAVIGAVTDVVTQHFNDDGVSSVDAVKKLVTAVNGAK
jgi:glucose/mannose transport system substrate-binding protein